MKREIPYEVALTAQKHGGASGEKQDIIYEKARGIVATFQDLGITVPIPDKYLDRPAKLRLHTDGRIIVDLKGGKTEAPVAGWGKRSNRIVRVFDIVCPGLGEMEQAEDLDKSYRCVVSRAKVHVGWWYYNGDYWVRHPASNCVYSLQSRGYCKDEAQAALGRCVTDTWTLVAVPFAPRELPGRQWNLDGPQLVYKPVAGPHPTWDRVFDHLGAYLTHYVKSLPWCKGYIQSGGDYLRAWAAGVIQEPYEPSALLSLWGSEDCGKSTLHESLKLLVDRGVVSAKSAVKEEFNKALDGALVCYVDEHKLTSPEILAKIRENITAKTLSVRAMHTDTYQVPNSCHFIHCCNREGDLAVWPGDTRCTVIQVADLIEDQKIPKSKLQPMLIAEAPAFTYTLLNIKLPPPVNRLRIPAVTTASKEEIQNENASQHARDLVAWILSCPQQRIEAGSALTLAELVTGRKWPEKDPPAFLARAGGAEWPHNGRAIRNLIEESRPYLKQHGIAVAIERDHHDGNQYVFSRNKP